MMLAKRHCLSQSGLRCAAPRCLLRRGRALAFATLQTQSPSVQQTRTVDCFYQGVIFDMDGTLTEAHIDFADMRQRTRIPQGDLFTVLEASTPEHIQQAMAVILEIEAEAAQRVSMKPGLMPLLEMLRDRKVPVALVTRNTTASVNAFLQLIGPEWKDLFNPIITREFSFVKPDKRLLLHVAQQWGVDPATLLMVGDSFEDVEVGNAAGTATCLVAGGGNEKPGAVVQIPAGAVATMTVTGLPQLHQMLLEGTQLRLGWPACKAAGEELGEDGSPAPGLDFVDWCIEQGALRNGGASFPRMGLHAGGLATSSELGSKVLHVACGAGGLTKMMCSQGMRVLATDSDVEAAQRRGLVAVQLLGPEESQPGHIASGSLQLARGQGPFDAVLLAADWERGLSTWWQPESLLELLSVLPEAPARAGCLCAEVPMDPRTNPASIFSTLNRCGVDVEAWQVSQTRQGRTLRLVARQRRG